MRYGRTRGTRDRGGRSRDRHRRRAGHAGPRARARVRPGARGRRCGPGARRCSRRRHLRLRVAQRRGDSTAPGRGGPCPTSPGAAGAAGGRRPTRRAPQVGPPAVLPSSRPAARRSSRRPAGLRLPPGLHGVPSAGPRAAPPDRSRRLHRRVPPPPRRRERPARRRLARRESMTRSAVALSTLAPPRLVVATAAVPDESEPLALLQAFPGTRHFYWEQPSAGIALAGAGATVAFSASGRDRFADLPVALADLTPDVVAVGGFSFDGVAAVRGPWRGFPAAEWVVPRVALVRRNGRARLVATALPHGSAPPLDGILDRAPAAPGRPPPP